MKIGYVCTNYNSAAFTVKAVESLLENLGHEIWISVVDNGSTETDVIQLKELAAKRPCVLNVLSQINVGYFAGLNLGIRALRQAHPDLNYMIVGNNDLTFALNFIDQIDNARAVFEEYPVVSPDIVTIDGVHQNPHVISGISKGREFVYDLYYSNYPLAVAIRWLALQARPLSNRKDETEWRVPRDIYQGHGSCYLLGPLFFEHCAELWAPTFLMGEEFFLSHQLADKGFSIRYEPTIQVIHHYHATVGRVPRRKMWKYACEAHHLYRKHVKLLDWSSQPNPSATLITHRKGSTQRAIQVCTNCVMDTTDTEIRFDGMGVCDHCRTFYEKTLPNWHTDQRGQQELERLIDDIKKAGRGKDFDCILGMSGGIDSSYLTYLAKEKFGLRPLVFHVDAGWNSQEAVNNIERLVDGLKLELFTEVIDWEEIRDLQLAYFKSGVSHIDQPQDLAYFGTMYKFAHRHNIKYTLTGANLSTECIRNPIEWVYYGDIIQLKDIHNQFGQAPLKTFPLSHILWHKIYMPYIVGRKVVRPLNYQPYVKADAMKLLVDKFGWQPYPQKHFESRFTRFVEGYWLPTRFGYDVRKVQFSSLIVTGQMTRAEAIERLKEPAYNPETINQDFEYVAKKLNIEPAELESYRKAPLRTYKDYKSQEVLYRTGAAIMKALGLEVGGKR